MKQILKNKSYIAINDRNHNVDVFFKSFSITILEAFEAFEHQTPSFCYHQELLIAGNCRMCLIETINALKSTISCLVNLSSYLDLTFPTFLLGSTTNILMAILEGNNLTTQLFKNANFPIIVLNASYFQNINSSNLQLFIQTLKSYTYLYRKNWHGFHVLNTSINDVGFNSLNKFSTVQSLDVSSYAILYLFNLSFYTFLIKKFFETKVLNYIRFNKKAVPKTVVYQSSGIIDSSFGAKTVQKQENPKNYLCVPTENDYGTSGSYLTAGGSFRKSANLLVSRLNLKTDCKFLRRLSNFTNKKNIFTRQVKDTNKKVLFDFNNFLKFRLYLSLLLICVTMLTLSIWYHSSRNSCINAQEPTFFSFNIKNFITKFKTLFASFFESFNKDKYAAASKTLNEAYSLQKLKKGNIFKGIELKIWLFERIKFSFIYFYVEYCSLVQASMQTLGDPTASPYNRLKAFGIIFVAPILPTFAYGAACNGAFDSLFSFLSHLADFIFKGGDGSGGVSHTNTNFDVSSAAYAQRSNNADPTVFTVSRETAANIRPNIVLDNALNQHQPEPDPGALRPGSAAIRMQRWSKWLHNHGFTTPEVMELGTNRETGQPLTRETSITWTRARSVRPDVLYNPDLLKIGDCHFQHSLPYVTEYNARIDDEQDWYNKSGWQQAVNNDHSLAPYAKQALEAYQQEAGLDVHYRERMAERHTEWVHNACPWLKKGK